MKLTPGQQVDGLKTLRCHFNRPNPFAMFGIQAQHI